MRQWVVFVLPCLILMKSGLAAAACADKFYSVEDIAACVEERSPDIQNLLLQVEVGKVQMQAAEQWK